MLRESQQIAVKVLKKLDDLGWTKKDLAEELGVSQQQITKIVSGKENLTIETQVKLQNALDIPVLASYYEKKVQEMVLTLQKKIENFATKKIQLSHNYQEAKTVKMECVSFKNEYVYQEAI